MWSKRSNSNDGLEPTKCPVCQAKFGYRDPLKVFKAHCDECRATFWWKPGLKKPVAIPDTKKPQRCGCNSCER